MIDDKAIIAQVLATLPVSLEPGEAPFNSSEIASRLQTLDLQASFLRLDEWLEENEHWLKDSRLRLSVDRSMRWNGEGLVFPEVVLADDRQINAVNELIAILEFQQVEVEGGLLEELLFLFEPDSPKGQNPRDELCAMAGYYKVVEDPTNWMMRHRTARQASRLSAATEGSVFPPVSRPRI